MISLPLFDLSLPSTPDPPKYISGSDPQKLLNLRDEGEERKHLQEKLSLFPPGSRALHPYYEAALTDGDNDLYGWIHCNHMSQQQRLTVIRFPRITWNCISGHTTRQDH